MEETEEDKGTDKDTEAVMLPRGMRIMAEALEEAMAAMVMDMAGDTVGDMVEGTVAGTEMATIMVMATVGVDSEEEEEALDLVCLAVLLEACSLETSCFKYALSCCASVFSDVL